MSAIPCRIAIHNLFVADPQPRMPREVIEALRTSFPGEWTDGTIRAHLIGLSMNHPSAHHYPHLQAFAFLTYGGDGRYALASGIVEIADTQRAVLAKPVRPRARQPHPTRP
jgi:hypothetical protein